MNDFTAGSNSFQSDFGLGVAGYNDRRNCLSAGLANRNNNIHPGLKTGQTIVADNQIKMLRSESHGLGTVMSDDNLITALDEHRRQGIRLDLIILNQKNSDPPGGGNAFNSFEIQSLIRFVGFRDLYGKDRAATGH